MVTQQYPSIAIKRTRESLYNLGKRVEQKTTHSVSSPDDTWELLNHHVSFIIPEILQNLKVEIKPNLPWADEHFKERIGGVPLNPPPSHVNWPFSNKKNKDHIYQEKFSHTYPERFWPKLAGNTDEYRRGIRYDYGDLADVINLLRIDPSTRQAYLPIWFPEDTGAVLRQRVPCTLGYHFIIREGFLHINYYIRSCDIIRHFNDDIYLACRLNSYIADCITRERNMPGTIRPGIFNMYITSLHCFYKEKERLKV